MVRRKNKKKQNELVFAYKVNLDYREQMKLKNVLCKKHAYGLVYRYRKKYVPQFR